MRVEEARSAAVERVRGAVGSLGAESCVIDTGGVRLHALVYGAGPVDVLIIPGITSPAPTWDFVARWLQDLARVVVLDVRGRGLSDAPQSGYQTADYVADLDAVISGLDLDRPVLLGHSMGARIAAAYGAARPGSARALLLLDPPMSGPGRPYPTPWASFERQLDEGMAGTDVDAVRVYYPRWPERELELRVEWLATCLPAAIRETYDAFEVERFEDWWGALVDQATLVYGGESPVVEPHDVARLRELARQATVVCVEGAGHMIPWDEPERTEILLRSLVHPHSAAAAAAPQGGAA